MVLSLCLGKGHQGNGHDGEDNSSHKRWLVLVAINLHFFVQPRPAAASLDAQIYRVLEHNGKGDLE
jgi:hypothetical protein